MDIKDLDNFIRPQIAIYVLAVYMLVLLLSKAPIGFIHLMGGIVFFLICSASITVNHYFDYETDKKSNQLYRFPVAKGSISRKSALGFSIGIMSLSIILTYFFLGFLAFLLVLFANFMIMAYSAPPVRMKERPYLETFWNGLGYGALPYYIAIAITSMQLSIDIHILGLIPFFIAASGHILLQVRDIESDKKSNVRTTSVVLGLKRMVKISKAMVLVSGLIIIYLTLKGFLNPLAWLAIAAGGFSVYEHKRMKNNVTKSYRKLQIIYITGGIFFVLSAI